MSSKRRTKQRAGRKGGYATTRKNHAALRRAGHYGGIARFANMTPEERTALARKAANALWAARRAEEAKLRGLEPTTDTQDEEDELVT